MIRLKDIAQAGNVSVMTVSKVMRDAPDISASTKPGFVDWPMRWGMFQTPQLEDSEAARHDSLDWSFRQPPTRSMPAS